MTVLTEERMTLDQVEENVWLDGTYSIRFDTPGDFLLVTIGVEYGSPAACFTHPNILRTERQIHCFKAYWPDGRKKWYERPGITHLLAIPKENVTLIKKMGYSYVYVEIGGQEYCLNVSGGTTGGNGGWTDFVFHGCSIGVTKVKKKIKTLVENAVIPEDIDIPPVREMDEDQKKHYIRLCAYYDTKKVLKEGDVVMARGFNDPFTIHRRPRRKQNFVCNDVKGLIRIPYKNVDWVETAKKNGIPLVKFS